MVVNASRHILTFLCYGSCFKILEVQLFYDVCHFYFAKLYDISIYSFLTANYLDANILFLEIV